jgi:hypothetical protein
MAAEDVYPLAGLPTIRAPIGDPCRRQGSAERKHALGRTSLAPEPAAPVHSLQLIETG